MHSVSVTRPNASVEVFLSCEETVVLLRVQINS